VLARACPRGPCIHCAPASLTRNTFWFARLRKLMFAVCRYCEWAPVGSLLAEA
jgi:hypothetical protein